MVYVIHFSERTFVSTHKKSTIPLVNTYPERVLGPLRVEKTILEIRSIYTTEKLGTNLTFLPVKTMRMMFFRWVRTCIFARLGPDFYGLTAGKNSGLDRFLHSYVGLRNN